MLSCRPRGSAGLFFFCCCSYLGDAVLSAPGFSWSSVFFSCVCWWRWWWSWCCRRRVLLRCWLCCAAIICEGSRTRENRSVAAAESACKALLHHQNSVDSSFA
ncbi:unnamed protein product, partial [Laminaria digitata]